MITVSLQNAEWTGLERDKELQHFKGYPVIHVGWTTHTDVTDLEFPGI